MPASTRSRLRRFAAAAGIATAAAVPFAAPAAADDAKPCAEVFVDDRWIVVCTDAVHLESCPFPSNGVVVVVLGTEVPVCFIAST